MCSLLSAGFLQKELVKDLLKECAKMKEFDHPNVLTLRGVCLDGGPAPYIIMPFMTNGSLQSHLKENRASLVLDPNSSDMDDMVHFPPIELVPQLSHPTYFNRSLFYWSLYQLCSSASILAIVARTIKGC